MPQLNDSELPTGSPYSDTILHIRAERSKRSLSSTDVTLKQCDGAADRWYHVQSQSTEIIKLQRLVKNKNPPPAVTCLLLHFKSTTCGALTVRVNKTCLPLQTGWRYRMLLHAGPRARRALSTMKHKHADQLSQNNDFTQELKKVQANPVQTDLISESCGKTAAPWLMPQNFVTFSEQTREPRRPRRTARRNINERKTMMVSHKQLNRIVSDTSLQRFRV